MSVTFVQQCDIYTTYGVTYVQQGVLGPPALGALYTWPMTAGGIYVLLTTELTDRFTKLTIITISEQCSLSGN